MDIHKLIAGISPETYCQPEMAKQVRRLLRKKDTVSPHEAVLQAAVPAEPKPANLLPLERLEEMDLFDCPGLKSPRSQFSYARDAFAESVEAFYFSILNHLEQLEGWDVFKLADEFQASLLASPFADATKQQSLIQRQVFEGLEAIHALTNDMIETVQQLETQQPAAGQDNSEGLDVSATSSQSDLELRRVRLRSQLSLLKLRAAAIRPWLHRGDLTSPHRGHSASLVDAFNTAVFQVDLLAVGPDVMPDAIDAGDLPRWMIKEVRRAYRPVLVLELRFRARPHRSRSQGYGYRGKAELTLTSYGLHNDELTVLRQAVETSVLRDSFQMGADEAAAALSDLMQRIEHLVHPQSRPSADEPSPEPNPFAALLSLVREAMQWLSGRHARRVAAEKIDLRSDTSLDGVARSTAILCAAAHTQDLLDALKAAASSYGRETA